MVAQERYSLLKFPLNKKQGNEFKEFNVKQTFLMKGEENGKKNGNLQV
jgi:hypothetical protein